MQNFQCALRRKYLEQGSSDQNLQMSISETTEANEICELFALVPPRFNKNQARYDFSNFESQMKIARFSSKSTPKNKILVFIGE